MLNKTPAINPPAQTGTNPQVTGKGQSPNSAIKPIVVKNLNLQPWQQAQQATQSQRFAAPGSAVAPSPQASMNLQPWQQAQFATQSQRFSGTPGASAPPNLQPWQQAQQATQSQRFVPPARTVPLTKQQRQEQQRQQITEYFANLPRGKK